MTNAMKKRNAPDKVGWACVCVCVCVNITLENDSLQYSLGGALRMLLILQWDINKCHGDGVRSWLHGVGV